MDTAKLASYAGSLIAIGLGVALIWIPPASIADQAGTFLTAGALLTGGFAGLGVTVTIPALRAQAQREAMAGRRVRAPKQKKTESPTA